jgi:hypothetical protein
MENYCNIVTNRLYVRAAQLVFGEQFRSRAPEKKKTKTPKGLGVVTAGSEWHREW